MDEDNLSIQKRKNFDDDDDDYDLTEIDKKRFSHLSYIDRYYKKYYKFTEQCENNPHLLLYHSNRVCIQTLPDTHPLIMNKNLYKIIKIDFKQNPNEKMKGRRKNNANFLQYMQPICNINCLKLDEVDEKQQSRVFTIYSLLNAKLIEINEKLLNEPELIQTKTLTLGYIAILYPKISNLKEQLLELIPHGEHINLLANDNTKIE